MESRKYMELGYQFEFEKYTDKYNAVISLCNAQKKLLGIGDDEREYMPISTFCSILDFT